MENDIQNPVLLLDTDCTMCNSSANFIEVHLKEGQTLEFYSLYSEEGKSFLKAFNFPEDYNESLVFIENNRAYTKSDAVLKISRKLKGVYSIAYIFLIIPRKLRNFIYDQVARHRHQIPL